MRQQDVAEWKTIPPPAFGGTPPGNLYQNIAEYKAIPLYIILLTINKKICILKKGVFS
jgi:hypothetical protein